MVDTRNTMARVIAGSIALGGTPFAVLFAVWPFEIGFPRGLLIYITLSPGWFAYFALIWTTLGKRLPGDPFTTWIPCIVVNGFWLVLALPDFDFDLSTKGFYTHIYLLAAVIGGGVGLNMEASSRAQRG